jgi:hypothetical protein
MSEGGYTYTTIVDRAGAGTRISTAFHLDARSYIQVYGAGGNHVHLSIEHGDVSVCIAPCSPERVTAEDVQAMQRLVEAATAYLGELQRLNTEQSERADTAA